MRQIGWSSRELGRRLGVRESSIRRYLQGSREVPPNLAAWLEGLATHMALTPRSLTTGISVLNCDRLRRSADQISRAQLRSAHRSIEVRARLRGSAARCLHRAAHCADANRSRPRCAAPAASIALCGSSPRAVMPQEYEEHVCRQVRHPGRAALIRQVAVAKPMAVRSEGQPSLPKCAATQPSAPTPQMHHKPRLTFADIVSVL